ncbi:MAG: minichromosome maintenance protein MCM, partial [Candidatus Aenigmarchaeota archaeon]|nr:minichromosome maintenance protein MCM [Candidatus Aenigmarchaeota archaeon]
SRFDLKFALKDRPDRTQDEKLADHIIMSRTRPELVEPAIDINLLRKYIAYSKQIIAIELTDDAAQRLKEFYVDMRNRYTGEDTNTISITLRQYEALIRMAEASAKIRLDTKIRAEDAERAINLMKYSLSQLGYDYETGRIDIDRVEGGMPAGRRRKIHQVLEIIESLQKTMKEVPVEDVKAAAEEQGIEGIDEIIERLKNEGTLFEPRVGFIKKSR